MDIHGYPWICVGIHEYPSCVSMDTHGYPWMSMDVHGYPWTYMDTHGYPWISIDIHEIPGRHVGQHFLFLLNLLVGLVIVKMQPGLHHRLRNKNGVSQQNATMITGYPRLIPDDARFVVK